MVLASHPNTVKRSSKCSGACMDARNLKAPGWDLPFANASWKNMEATLLLRVKKETEQYLPVRFQPSFSHFKSDKFYARVSLAMWTIQMRVIFPDVTRLNTFLVEKLKQT